MTCRQFRELDQDRDGFRHHSAYKNDPDHEKAAILDTGDPFGGVHVNAAEPRS